MGSECEIYSGKLNPEDYNSESDNESSSDVSCDVATDDEEIKSSKNIIEGAETIDETASGEQTKTKGTEENESRTKKTEDVAAELEKLAVKEE